MSVVGCLSINRAEEAEPFYDRGGPEIERLHIFRNFALITGPQSTHHHRNLPCHSNSVGNLNLHTLREPLANDIASHEAAEISSATVYLGWVFSAESATSVAGGSTVRVHDDFPPRYATIGGWTTGAEASRRVYMKGYRGMEPLPQCTRSEVLPCVLRDFALLRLLAVLS
jgi:hypothetical protein